MPPKRTREEEDNERDNDDDQDERLVEAVFTNALAPALAAALKSLKTTKQKRILLRKCGGYEKCPDQEEVDTTMSFLEKMKHHVRATFPEHSQLPPETMHAPSEKSKNFGHCKLENTVVVDAFLYDEEDVDLMCEEKIFAQYFCEKCGSTDVSETTFVSHSFSVEQLKYLFEVVLVGEMKDTRVSVVDVGSRMGTVVCAAAHYANGGGSAITGIEINPFYVGYSTKLISELKLKKATVVQGDALSVTFQTTLREASIVVLNNVFEWFSNDDKARQAAWQTMQTTLSNKGQVIIAVPSLQESFQSCGLSPKLVSKWVTEIEIEFEGESDDADATSSVQEAKEMIRKYRVN